MVQQLSASQIPQDFSTTAIKYLRSGFSVIPLNIDQKPAIAWASYQSELMTEQEAVKVFASAYGIAIICGAVSGNLEVIHINCMYDLTGSLWTDYINLIDEILQGLTGMLVIATANHKSYHIYYRSSEIGDDTTLANRSATPHEIEETYRKQLKEGVNEEEAKKRSEKDQVRELIGTHGKGGYVVAPPSFGYEMLQGNIIPGEYPNLPKMVGSIQRSLEKRITTLSVQERDMLINIARSFNEVQEKATLIYPPITFPLPSNLFTLEDDNQKEDRQRSLVAAVKEIQSNKKKEAQAKELKNLLSRATALLNIGEVDNALKLLVEGIKKVNQDTCK